MNFNFFTPTGSFHHVAACLMEGLIDLGYRVNSNIQPQGSIESSGIAKPFSNNFYASKVEVTTNLSNGVLIVDATNGYGQYGQAIVDSAKSNKVCILNMNDGVNWVDYPEQFLVFSGHYTHLAKRNGNIHPIGFGVSNEAIELAKSMSAKTRTIEVLRNFRPSWQQSVRNSLDLTLIPNLAKFLNIKEDITDQNTYIEQLCESQAVAVYCGEYYRDLRANPWFVKNSNENQIAFKEISSQTVILRFDSWRFYEAALFGACPIHLDLEKYGLETSKNPIKWEEYIPIDLECIHETVIRIKKEIEEDSEFFIKIGTRARNWVINEHSPKASTERFIQILKKFNYL